jgi:hypothetical protein
MTLKKTKTLVASAVSLALSSMMLAGSLNAGIIDNSNNTVGKLGACGVEGSPTACVGAWDLTNVDVKLIRVIDGTEFGSFDEATGDYTSMTYGDSFRSYVTDADNSSLVMARVSGKDWPVGEPTGIKAVINDTQTNNGKPQNCLINTSYLGDDPANPDDAEQHLDDDPANPTICSSFFQSHKRFKIAMLPATVAGIDAVGAEGKPIDLVFNVTNEGSTTVRPYQVFSKINNYTGKRLQGYKIVVGTGVGTAFVSADAQGIENKLFISLGIGEGADSKGVADGSDLFDAVEGFATFSHGLFGAPDKHFTANGFFDTRTAGFDVEQVCSFAACDQNREVFPGITVNLTDTIRSTGALTSNYVDPTSAINFGDWLHYGLVPMGIFYDFDSDPTTDADLVAYWNGSGWMRNYDSGFAAVSEADLNAWAADARYSVDTIEDTVNLGINYIVNVGDDIPSGKVTIRIIPIVGDQTQPTPWIVNAPAAGDLLPVPTTGSGGGGGCAVGGSGRFDPTLPALLAMGLGFFGWRRFKAGK